MTNPDQWQTIYRLVGWLDSENGSSQEEHTLRLLKLAEEVGEVSQAWIGYTGQNPRKGITHTREDVCGELVDVMVTAAVALVSITGGTLANPDDLVAAKLAKIDARAKGAS